MASIRLQESHIAPLRNRGCVRRAIHRARSGVTMVSRVEGSDCREGRRGLTCANTHSAHGSAKSAQDPSPGSHVLTAEALRTSVRGDIQYDVSMGTEQVHFDHTQYWLYGLFGALANADQEKGKCACVVPCVVLAIHHCACLLPSGVTCVCLDSIVTY